MWLVLLSWTVVSISLKFPKGFHAMNTFTCSLPRSRSSLCFDDRCSAMDCKCMDWVIDYQRYDYAFYGSECRSLNGFRAVATAVFCALRSADFAMRSTWSLRDLRPGRRQNSSERAMFVYLFTQMNSALLPIAPRNEYHRLAEKIGQRKTQHTMRNRRTQHTMRNRRSPLRNN